MCSDVGSQRTTAMLPYTYSKDWWTSNKLPLTHLVTAITLLIKLTSMANKQLGELECLTELPSQLDVHFVSSLGGEKLTCSKIFLTIFMSIGYFSFLSSAKRLLLLIIVVAWVWFNTSEVNMKETSRNQHPAQPRSFLTSPFLIYY